MDTNTQSLPKRVGVATATTVKRAVLLFDKVYYPEFDMARIGIAMPPRRLECLRTPDMPSIALTSGETIRPGDKSYRSIMNYILGSKIGPGASPHAHVPFYEVEHPFISKQDAPGATAVKTLCLDVVDIDESGLTWDAVIDLKADEEFIARYRSFDALAYTLLQSRSIDEANDMVAQALEDYRLAMKHLGSLPTRALKEMFLSLWRPAYSIANDCFSGRGPAASLMEGFPELVGGAVKLKNTYCEYRTAKQGLAEIPVSVLYTIASKS